MKANRLLSTTTPAANAMRKVPAATADDRKPKDVSGRGWSLGRSPPGPWVPLHPEEDPEDEPGDPEDEPDWGAGSPRRLLASPGGSPSFSRRGPWTSQDPRARYGTGLMLQTRRAHVVRSSYKPQYNVQLACGLKGPGAGQESGTHLSSRGHSALSGGSVEADNSPDS